MQATITPVQPIPDTNSALAPSGLSAPPLLADPNLAEAALLTGDFAGTVPTVTLTGNGGVKGQYRLKVTVASWQGATAITLTGKTSGVVASFGPKGQLGEVIRSLAADTYTWGFTGGATGPQGVALSIQAI